MPGPKPLQFFFLREEQVNQELERIMVGSSNDIYAIAQQWQVDMRRAAYLLAVGRLAGATMTRGIYP